MEIKTNTFVCHKQNSYNLLDILKITYNEEILKIKVTFIILLDLLLLLLISEIRNLLQGSLHWTLVKILSKNVYKKFIIKLKNNVDFSYIFSFVFNIAVYFSSS